MADSLDGRVAVYLDFDNIVISWYDRVHGRNAFSRDRQRIAEDPTDPEIAARLKAAVVDVGAIIDYASSYGTLVLTRAYADWSSPMNAEYRSQLVARAVDLVQLFPTAAYSKNGADIRLAIDAVEDMFRLTDLSHIVVVAGDSDYVPLAQRCKRLGRYIVGIGVAGSTAKALMAACDEFATYESLPGVAPEQQTEEPGQAYVDTAMTGLLIRALWLGLEKEDSDWLHSSAVKQQMKRMDPSFNEKSLGFRTFSDFLKSRSDVVELEESGHERLVRLREQP